MRFILALILCLIPSVSLAQWTDEQKTLGAITLGAMLIDYGQTRYIAKSPRFKEKNQYLGDRPSGGKIAGHFIGSAIIGGLVLNALPSEARTWALRTTAVVEIWFVAHNFSIGAKVRF